MRETETDHISEPRATFGENRQRIADVSVRHTDAQKGKVFRYSLPSVGPGADPGVQAVSPQVT